MDAFGVLLLRCTSRDAPFAAPDLNRFGVAVLLSRNPPIRLLAQEWNDVRRADQFDERWVLSHELFTTPWLERH